MHIETVIVGELQVNCHVLWQEPSRGALVLDPGWNAPRIIDCLRRNNLTVACYLLTHGHVDHLSALADMYDVMPAPIALHAADLEWAFTEENMFPPFCPPPRAPPEVERKLRAGRSYEDAGLAYEVVHTPGHTPGSVCFLFREQHALFSGDTLFAGSIGRTDFPRSDQAAMEESLRTLSMLSAGTDVYPGHGPCTSIRHELRVNPFLRRPRPERQGTGEVKCGDPA
jgi:glyoxylase-like metal-dependent hydrolase (beta-lactamase superfamily II)